MTVLEALSYSTRIVLALVAVLALADFVRHRDRVRLDIALMLGALALAIVVQQLSLLVGLARWASGLLGVAVLSQPYLLLRLVQDFRHVPTLLHRAALMGLLLSWALLLSFPTPPTGIRLALLAYFALVEGYAVSAFASGAIVARGVTQWRLAFAAAGSALLIAVLVVGTLATFAPGAAGGLRLASGVMAVVAAISYYLGFTPPRWLRRAWQGPEFFRFLRMVAGIAAEERAARTLEQLCSTAARVAGGAASFVALWDEAKQHFRIETSSPPALANSTSALGLNLVNIFAQKLKGTMEVDTSAGTVFRLTFPRPG